MVTATMIDERQAGIQEALERKGASFRIHTSSNFKNNGVKDGITLDSGNPICPVVYPTDEIWNGSDEDVADFLMNLEADVADNVPSFDVQNILSREFILEKVQPRLFGGLNRENMESNNRVYKEFMDLLIGYYVPIELNKEGMSSISVTGQMLIQADITLDEVHEAALENVSTEYKIQSMSQLMAGFMGADFDETMSVPDMLVVSNELNLQGAASILSQKALKELSEMLGGAFVILPSSIHEVICIPLAMMSSAKELLQMVTDINSSVVNPEDRLTDSVYICTDGILEKVA